MVCRCAHDPAGKLSVTQRISWGHRTRLATSSPRARRPAQGAGTAGEGRFRGLSPPAGRPRAPLRPRTPSRVPPSPGPHTPAPAHTAPPRLRLAPRPRSCYATAQGPRRGLPGRGPEGPAGARAGRGGAGRGRAGAGSALRLASRIRRGVWAAGAGRAAGVRAGPLPSGACGWGVTRGRLRSWRFLKRRTLLGELSECLHLSAEPASAGKPALHRPAPAAGSGAL